MTKSLENLGNLDQYCLKIIGDAARNGEYSNPFRERLLAVEEDFSNMMDSTDGREEIPALMIDLYEVELNELDELQKAREALRNVLPKFPIDEDRDVKNAYGLTQYTITDLIRSSADRLISIYNLCHYFANYFQRGQKEHIERLLSVDENHLPNETGGFFTKEMVKKVGGIEQYMMLRDIIFRLYHKD